MKEIIFFNGFVSLQIIPEQKPKMKTKNNSLIPSARHLIDAMKDVPLIYIRVIILNCAFHSVFFFHFIFFSFHSFSFHFFRFVFFISFFSFHFFYLIFWLICLWHRDDGLTGAQIIRKKHQRILFYQGEQSYRRTHFSTAAKYFVRSTNYLINSVDSTHKL